MGYDTTFTGRIEVDPPLNEHEVRYLRRFAETRRVHRGKGPYYCGGGFRGTAREPDIIDYCWPPQGQLNAWCQWVPAEYGDALVWDGHEKFYEPVDWMTYLIGTFLKPGAALQAELAAPVPGRWYAPEFAHFTFDHILNGRVLAQGEDPQDTYTIIVADNVVSSVKGHHPEGGPDA